MPDMNLDSLISISFTSLSKTSVILTSMQFIYAFRFYIMIHNCVQFFISSSSFLDNEHNWFILHMEYKFINKFYYLF
jgi:hypothetical protein